MACPALPLCGLAIGEAERALPDVIRRVRGVLDKLGMPDDHVFMRMTGCPNGCSRPYIAEMGFVGDGPNTYQLWIGASANQTRLAEVYMERMHVAKLEESLEPLLAAWRDERLEGEAFGDFSMRVGFAHLKDYAGSYAPKPTTPRALAAAAVPPAAGPAAVAVAANGSNGEANGHVTAASGSVAPAMPTPPKAQPTSK